MAAVKPVKPGALKSAPKSPRQRGRPKSPAPIRAAKAFKTGATGETRNSTTTDPNIIFWLGMGLIIASGWSSHRIPNIFKDAWNMGVSGAKVETAEQWFTNIKITGSQFLFLFILTITARAIPPLAKVYLVILIGIWVLWLMRNPQMVALLNWSSVGTNNQQDYNKLVASLSTGTKTK